MPVPWYGMGNDPVFFNNPAFNGTYPAVFFFFSVAEFDSTWISGPRPRLYPH